MGLLFTRFPFESHFGGAEVQTLSLMQGLKERGHEVMFLGSCPTLLAECKQQAIGYWQLAIGNPPVTRWNAISFAWRQCSMRTRLTEAVQKLTANCQMPTAVFMLSLTEKLLLTDWAVSKGIKVCWVEHDRIGRWLTHNPWLPKLRTLSGLATTIVVSDLSRDLYLKLGWKPENIVSIPNGIDVEKFAPCDVLPLSVSKGQHDVFNVGCIARLTRDKGIDLLIEAVANLPNVTLTIVGSGREEKNIRTLANQVNRQTSKRVHMLSATDPATFYRTIDCLVLPSREHDPFGLVIAEAMAAGVPTIVTDTCGIAAHLRPDDALIVPAGDARALRNAIETLIRRPQLARAFAQHGPQIARERFSRSTMIDAYAALLEKPTNTLY